MSKQEYLKYKIASRKGAAVALESGFDKLPIDPITIAESKGIMVRGKPENTGGVSGMLLRNGNNFGIMYSTNIDNLGYQRFSVAHELGHYCLEGHIDHVFSNTDIHESRAGFVSGDSYEREADHFAAGMLMPEKLFLKEIKRHEDGLKAIQNLAVICKTSIEATAIKYAEMVDGLAAIIISHDKEIDYCFMSTALRDLDGLEWIKKASLIPQNTITHKFNLRKEAVISGEEDSSQSDIRDWFGGAKSIEMEEEVIGLGSYGKTLTVLTSDYFEDEDDEEDLEESWTPNF